MSANGMFKLQFFRQQINVILLMLLSARPSLQKSTLQQGEQIVGWEGGQVPLLTSENGMFKLQFNRFNQQIISNKSYLGIWYSYEGGLPIWIANRNSPLQLDSAALAIDRNGSLKILQRTGGELITIYEYSATKYNHTTSVALEDSGNLVLYELDSYAERVRVLWQSFDHPTDTLIPGMKIGIHHRTGLNWSLTSPRSELSAAVGSFTLGMDPNATTQLVIWQRGKVIWRSGGWKNGVFSGLRTHSFLNLLYNFSYIANEYETYFHYTLDTRITLFPMLRIDADGLIKSLRENHERQELDCRLQNSVAGAFLRDGCVPLEVPKCRISSSKINFVFSTNSGFMSSQGFRYSDTENLTLEDCMERCITSCSCSAYAPTSEDDDTGCEIWNSTFSFSSNPPSTTSSWRTIYLRDQDEDKGQANGWWLWVTLAVGLTIITPSFVGFCYMLWFKFRHRGDRKINLKSLFGIMEENGLRKTSDGTAEKQQEDENELQMFNFETIAAATNYFSATNKLGQGGFGPVYKGRLANGREIAVKRLSRSSGQGFLEFRNEAVLIAKLQHTNLVRLFGLCISGNEQILVYEYMANKSLDIILFDSRRKSVLDWKKRFDIIEGIAQGLLYLHKYSRLRVIHRDVKTSNILLDNDMNPKISDFGMARILGLRESEANTKRVVGTYGYMSPEYVMHGVVSTKLDVFSFGVLLLEIVSGKKNSDFYDPAENPVTLVGYAWQLWREGQGLQLLDQTLADFRTQNVLRCIHIGLLCVQDQATNRPTMSDVVAMLSNDTLGLPDPKQPAFFMNAVVEVDRVEINEQNCSKNTMTISVMEAR